MFFRSYWIRTVNSPDRMQSLGLTAGLTPVFEKYYTQEKRKGIMDRYLNEYFLTNPIMSYWIIGIVAAIEERIAVTKDISRDVVSATKTALMGPLAAIGDGLYNGTLRPVVAGIACILALSGNIFAPILFVLIMAGVNIAIRASGIFVGYKQGASFFEKLQETGLLKKIIEAANIVAFIVVGAFASTNVSLSLAIKWMVPEAKEATTLQSVIDGIMPKILPLSLTLFTWWLIEKKKISPIKLIIGYLVLGIIGYYLGIIA
ncbi:MAG: PTS system mannose/fructose/sorbose family transporter subunit IID [Tepidanaerobacteraceae bacterium]|nr:PTS system mannose/fructose/sorbose family transporter subunit IID [Tepidanaerobacteraceae bacterium]